MTALIDNDVMYKLSLYSLVGSIKACVPENISNFAIVGAARYMVEKKLKRKPPTRGADSAIAEYKEFLKLVEVLEPSPEEIELAADFEHEAQQLHLDLDAGESLLCAIFIKRDACALLTGDKRAIKALEKLIGGNEVLAPLSNKAYCFEQLFVPLIAGDKFSEIRAKVCVEKGVDTAIANCFSCYSAEAQAASVKAGLESYIRSLRQEAPTVLSASP